MLLTSDQVDTYFAARLEKYRPTGRDRTAVRCPFHGDTNASATVFLSGNGGFNCHACQAKGNVVQFEARLSGCDLPTAEANVAALTGAVQGQKGSVGRLEAVYDYRTAFSGVAFQKRRYRTAEGEKTFRIFRPEGVSGWASGIGDAPRVLFHLPDVISANVVFCAEGEKDCETLDQLNLADDFPGMRIATTCNFDGAWKPGQASKWLPEYEPYFAGKRVQIFADNDESGRCWASGIAAQVVSLAASVRIVELPGLPDKGDVTDWMQTHTREELLQAMRAAPLYRRDTALGKTREVIIPSVDFMTVEHPEPDWLVSELIEAGSNGFIAADPKIGKSLASVDLCLSLACGLPWLGFAVNRPVRTALISREDNPAVTQRRMRRLMAGKGVNGLVEENLYVNSRAQTRTLMLDNEPELVELIRALNERQIEFCILDVFNKLHSADENDNTQMVKALSNVTRLQEETGCSVCMVHHFNKGVGRNLQTRMRGSSAISGFAEFIIGLSFSDSDKEIRKAEFVTKSCADPPDLYYRVDDLSLGSLRLSVVEDPDAEESSTRRKDKYPIPFTPNLKSEWGR